MGKGRTADRLRKYVAGRAEPVILKREILNAMSASRGVVLVEVKN